MPRTRSNRISPTIRPDNPSSPVTERLKRAKPLGTPLAKQPLQDITSRFIEPTLTPDANPKKLRKHLFSPLTTLLPESESTSPLKAKVDRSLSSRRRVKAPTGVLADALKARLVAKGKGKEKAVRSPSLSSLPPSSPPSDSSRFPAPPKASNAPAGPSHLYDEDAENRDAYLNDDDQENEMPPMNSDPFGFFALERRLKEQRVGHILKDRLPIRPSWNPTYSLILQEDEAEEELPKHLLTPPARTRRRHVREPGILHQGRPSSPGTNSAPSSPSPVKHATDNYDGATASAVPNDLVHSSPEKNNESDYDAIPAGRPGKGKTRAIDSNKKKGRQVKKSRDSGSPVNPEALAQSLQALLPKRASTRLATKRGKRKRTDEGSGSEGEQVTAKKKARVTKKKQAVPNATRKGKAKAKPRATGGSDLDSDEREKLAVERQARLDYFKSIEEYSFEKEDVYVV